jgi:hypothetical protein
MSRLSLNSTANPPAGLFTVDPPDWASRRAGPLFCLNRLAGAGSPSTLATWRTRGAECQGRVAGSAAARSWQGRNCGPKRGQREPTPLHAVGGSRPQPDARRQPGGHSSAIDPCPISGSSTSRAATRSRGKCGPLAIHSRSVAPARFRAALPGWSAVLSHSRRTRFKDLSTSSFRCVRPISQPCNSMAA